MKNQNTTGPAALKAQELREAKAMLAIFQKYTDIRARASSVPQRRKI